MRRASRARHAVLGAALVLAACAAPRPVEPLAEAVRAYNDGVRWQRFDDAAAHVPGARRDQFLDHRDQLGSELRITHYEIVRVRHDAAGHQARVHVKLTWYLDSRGTVHETHMVQRWQRHGPTWLLMGETHLRGEPMPEVAASDRGAAPARRAPGPDALPDMLDDEAERPDTLRHGPN